MPRPLQARQIGGLLDDVFRQYRTYFVPLLIISLVFLAPILILESFISAQTPALNYQMLSSGHFALSQLFTQAGPQHAQVNWSAQLAALVIGLISLNVTSPLSQGAYYALTRDTLQHDRTKPSPWSYIRQAVARWGAYLSTLWLIIFLGVVFFIFYAGIVWLASIGQGFASVLLLLVTLVGGALLIWLGIRLTFVFVAVIVDKRCNWGAIRFSYQLTAGAFWRVFFILLGADIVLGLASSGLATVLNLVLPQTALRILGTGIISVLLAPLLNVLIANLYLDLRFRQNGDISELPVSDYE